jgi:hypothetical protein
MTVPLLGTGAYITPRFLDRVMRLSDDDGAIVGRDNQQKNEGEPMILQIAEIAISPACRRLPYAFRLARMLNRRRLLALAMAVAFELTGVTAGAQQAKIATVTLTIEGMT